MKINMIEELGICLEEQKILEEIKKDLEFDFTGFLALRESILLIQLIAEILEEELNKSITLND